MFSVIFNPMKKTIKDYITVLIGTVFGRGVAFINSIIIARTLGKEDFGRFTIFFMIMVLTWMIAQAFDSVFVRYAKTAQDEKQKIEFLRVSFFLKVVYGFGAAILAYPVSWLIAEVCFRKPEMTSLIILAILSGVFQAFLMTVASIFQEKEKFNTFAFLYASYTFSIFIMLLLLQTSVVAFTLENVVFVYLFISIIVGLTSIFLLIRRKIKYVWPVDPKCLWKCVHFGKWVFGSMILAFVFYRVDTMLLPRYVSFDTVGVYGVAQQIIMIISVLAGTLANVFLPKACGALQSADVFKKYIIESLVIVAVILCAIFVLILFAGKIILFLYGAKYLDGEKIVQILLCGWIFYIAFLPFGALFYALDDTRTRFLIDVFRFLVAIVLMVVLLPLYKEFGAAWGITITHLLGCSVGFGVLFGRLRQHKWS